MKAIRFLKDLAKNREHLALNHPTRIGSRKELIEAYKRNGHRKEAALLPTSEPSIRDKTPERSENSSVQTGRAARPGMTSAYIEPTKAAYWPCACQGMRRNRHGEM